MITESFQRSFYEYLRPRNAVKCGIWYQNVCPFVPSRHSDATLNRFKITTLMLRTLTIEEYF